MGSFNSPKKADSQPISYPVINTLPGNFFVYLYCLKRCTFANIGKKVNKMFIKVYLTIYKCL